VTASWILLATEAVLCAALSRTDISHHLPAQYLSLGSLLLWIPMTPAYYTAFSWHPSACRWRTAFLCWWAALIISGWVLFLPGVLDHFKFTDGLVGHSIAALAGFVTALLIFVMTQLLGDNGSLFNRTWSFYTWNIGVLSYVIIMTIAGWFEGSDPAFTIVPGIARNLLYFLRLLTGLAMLAASADWLRDASRIRRNAAASDSRIKLTTAPALEKTA